MAPPLSGPPAPHVSVAGGVTPPLHVYPIAPAVVQATFASAAQPAVFVLVVQQYPNAPPLSGAPAPQLSGGSGVTPPGQVYPVAPAVVQATFVSAAQVVGAAPAVLQQ